MLLFACSAAVSQEREAVGSVTFVAGPTVYASLGRKSGLADSSTGFIRLNSDTIAVLRLTALSSKSSSWSVVRSSRGVKIGDTITVRIQTTSDTGGGPQLDTIRSSLTLPSDFAGRMIRQYEAASAVTVHGRLSLQYYGIQFGDRTQSMGQPALGFSLTAAIRDVPIRVSLYGVHRQRARGTLSPFVSHSRPETRLYRFSAEYDDGTTMLLAGRIYPMTALPMSVIDGISAARRVGKFTAGIAGGTEPTLTFRLRQKHLWKGMAFLSYQTDAPFSWGTGVVYARSYILKALVRETASFSFSVSAPSGLSLSGYSDIDLRRPMSKAVEGNPSLTSLMLLGSARIHSSVSVFAGIDGARSVPGAADYGIISDTLFNRTLRSGLTAGTSIFLQSWIWNISYSPRTGPEPFGREYSASTSIGTHNLFSSGFGIQSTANTSSNAFTTYASYGLQARRNEFGIDWRIRFQYYGSTIRQMDALREGTVVGFDLVGLVSQAVSLMASFDGWRGATIMNVMFFEVSWRF